MYNEGISMYSIKKMINGGTDLCNKTPCVKCPFTGLIKKYTKYEHPWKYCFHENVKHQKIKELLK